MARNYNYNPSFSNYRSNRKVFSIFFCEMIGFVNYELYNGEIS